MAFRAGVYVHPRRDSQEQLEPCRIISGEDLLMYDDGNQNSVDSRHVNVLVNSPECLAHLKTN